MVGNKERRYQLILTIVMTLISLVMVIPLILLLMASVTSNNEIVMHGYSFWPKEFSLEAYRYIWNEKGQIFRAYGVTLMVTAIGTVTGAMMTLLYGYVLAHQEFPGRTFLAFYLFFTMLFNGGLVPTYIMYTRYLHMKNTVGALIIPALLMNAFNVILARTYIQSNMPAALSEAAQIDGATEFRIFGQVALPLCKPIIATIGLDIRFGNVERLETKADYIASRYAVLKGSYSRLGIPCRPPVFQWPVSRGVLCIHRSRQKKGLFLTILILYSAANAAELLPLVVKQRR